MPDRPHAALLREARAVLDHNWTGAFTRPTEHLYPHQWNWDAGFISIGLTRVHPERAVAELRHLFRGQWAHGMVPHIVFNPETTGRYFPGPDFWQTESSAESPAGIPTSGITQPPVLGIALYWLMKHSPDRDLAKSAAREFLPAIRRFHQYLYQHRDPRREGLVHIRHPWEAGTDNSPAWDAVMAATDLSEISLPMYERQDTKIGKRSHRPTQRDYDYYVYLVDLFRKVGYDEEIISNLCPFQVQDPLFNAILVWANECMAEVAEWLGASSEEWRIWADVTRNALRRQLWNPDRGCFDFFDLIGARRILSDTNSGLIALLAGALNEAEANQLVQMLQGPSFSGTPQNPAWLCPTTALDSPDFNLEKYWRGPVWINTNWLLYHGLQRYGFHELAGKVRQDSLDLLTEFGFQEYFIPYRQLPEGIEPHLGAGKFSWSASLCIDWLLDDSP